MKSNNTIISKILIVLLVFTSHLLSAQVSGTITDTSNNEPLIGASVVIKGAAIGTITDMDGKYKLDAPSDATLIVSYVGYDTQEFPVNGQSVLDIQLSQGIELEQVTVVGSRGKPRTDVERPVPVDVVSAKELKITGQTDLGQMVQFSSPSFNSAKYGVNGTTNYADPASLRGMGPDQSLVLVNGKRRHPFSSCCSIWFGCHCRHY